MNFSELLSGFTAAAQAGAAKALPASCLPESIGKAEAYRRYGRSNVDRWLSEGLLSPASPNEINREKLEAVSAASNRITYLPVAAR